VPSLPTWADTEAIKSILAAPPPEMAAVMEAHGVVQPLTLYIESGQPSGSGVAEAVAPGEARLRNVVGS
jgi:hypothetical protein